MKIGSNKGSDAGESLIVISSIIVFIFAAWVLFGWLMPYLSGCMDPAIRGQFGDQFGAVNSLFAGFGFAGLVYTILLQRKEMADAKQQQGEADRALADQMRLQGIGVLVSARSALLAQRTTEFQRAHQCSGMIKVCKKGASNDLAFEDINVEEYKQEIAKEVFKLKESLEYEIELLASHKILKAEMSVEGSRL